MLKKFLNVKIFAFIGFICLFIYVYYFIIGKNIVIPSLNLIPSDNWRIEPKSVVKKIKTIKYDYNKQFCKGLFLNDTWKGYNFLSGKFHHLNSFKNRIHNIIHNDNNIMKYKPIIFYETRIKSLNRILDKITSKKTFLERWGPFPTDIYGLRIIYSLDSNIKENKNDEFLAKYIKNSINKELNNTALTQRGMIAKDKENAYMNLKYEWVRDYISQPKDNGYKSLHFGIWDNNCLFEIQIRSIKMHKWAIKTNYH